MDDLISRQAVLDALRARFGVDFAEGKWWSSTHVLAAVESVPAVATQEPRYCDRNICIKNEYNGIGCDECEVTKSQEPCEDAISRKAAIKAVKDWLYSDNGDLRGPEYELRNLPSVQPQEPCDDAISREAAIEAIEKWFYSADVRVPEKVLSSLPSVTPQYTDAEIQKMQELEQAEIEKAYEIGKDEGGDVLDKIRAEIMIIDGLEEALEIIDKYRAESVVPEPKTFKEFKVGEKIPQEEWQKGRSVTEIIEEVRERMCNKYCKYPYEWDEETQGELSESEICESCPLNRL